VTVGLVRRTIEAKARSGNPFIRTENALASTDGSYDLAAYRAIFASQEPLIILAYLAYFGTRNPPNQG
jgi:hypothetical protein